MSTAAEDKPKDETPVDAESEPELSELELAQREVAELNDKNLRLIAELRNTQQRLERDKGEALRYAEAGFARDLLIILDDLERTQRSASEADNVQSVADGVRIVYEHFLKVLKDRNIEPIDAVGQTFDPDLHEAMLQRASSEHASGTVMEELTRGYRMHGRVIRPARVVVSSGPAEQASAED
ncbi:MAG: nucleotide exchange factor GrpE [Phycisphaerae bacterium]|nr:nucleotide exchange factor GrpE [Phycisphaerae bacterium]